MVVANDHRRRIKRNRRIKDFAGMYQRFGQCADADNVAFNNTMGGIEVEGDEYFALVLADIGALPPDINRGF